MLKTLIDYNYSEHRQLWEIIAALDEAVFLEDAGYSIGSIQREVVHIIRADHLWFARTIGESDPNLLPYETSDRQVIRAAWDELEQRIRDYVANADEATLKETMSYTNNTNEFIRRKRWEMLYHLINHGSVHRAEICAMLHMLGHTVDFEVSLRQFLEDRDLGK
jgi:uncharacterized damage-inducible protein DinB